MKDIKFKRVFFFDEEKTKFSHEHIWGVGVNETTFTSPSQNNVAFHFTDYQFTGLQDSEGVDIYEGNIVAVHKFCEELGADMGVMEGEKEFIAEIGFSMYGGIFLIGGKYSSGPLWEYEDGFHEESLKVLPQVYKRIKIKD